MDPRGLRLNNPGCIRSSNWKKWPGAIGVDEEGHLIFKKPIDGIRAIVINLKAYRKNHGIRTLRGISNRWVKYENSQTSKNYLKSLRQHTGFGSDQKLDFGESRTLRILTRAIIKTETGTFDYEPKAFRSVFPHE